MDFKRLECCKLCPRECGVNRNQGERGVCGETSSVRLARAALHLWEEPCISGTRGCGAVFFSGCSLGCRFCQNRSIASGHVGRSVGTERLSDIFLELQEKGAVSLNLVTGGHFIPQILEALGGARERGLEIPVVYNSSGYEKRETLKLLEGYVDVYLPDFKYMDGELAARYSGAGDYPLCAREALEEMIRQTGRPVFSADGLMKRGVLVRHLILPGHTKDSMAVLKYLIETYGEEIYISILNQYTPMPWMKEDPGLGRRVTKREYDRVVDYGLELGLTCGFIQEGETAEESFIPDFDYEGLYKSS